MFDIYLERRLLGAFHFLFMALCVCLCFYICYSFSFFLLSDLKMYVLNILLKIGLRFQPSSSLRWYVFLGQSRLYAVKIDYYSITFPRLSPWYDYSWLVVQTASSAPRTLPRFARGTALSPWEQRVVHIFILIISIIFSLSLSAQRPTPNLRLTYLFPVQLLKFGFRACNFGFSSYFPFLSL